MRIIFLIPALAVFASTAPALAQEPSADYIACQLDPACPKPGTKPNAAPKCPPGKLCRSINPIGDIKQQTESAINLNIAFEYNSAVLQNDARITLDNLGKALNRPNLATYTFLIGGHTDLKGSAAYNKVLSERRARAVREYLVTHFGISEARLTAQGFGSLQLIDPAHPYDGVNRRVQIVNMSTAHQ